MVILCISDTPSLGRPPPTTLDSANTVSPHYQNFKSENDSSEKCSAQALKQFSITSSGPLNVPEIGKFPEMVNTQSELTRFHHVPMSPLSKLVYMTLINSRFVILKTLLAMARRLYRFRLIHQRNGWALAVGTTLYP